MIIHMNNTSSATIGLRMEELRDTVGSVALGRVLTLVIVAKNDGGVRDGIKAAAGASRAHPCRIVTIVPVESDVDRLDAEFVWVLRQVSLRLPSCVATARPVLIWRPLSRHCCFLIPPLWCGGYRMFQRMQRQPTSVRWPSDASPPRAILAIPSRLSCVCATPTRMAILISAGVALPCGATIWLRCLTRLLTSRFGAPRTSTVLPLAPLHVPAGRLAGAAAPGAGGD